MRQIFTLHNFRTYTNDPVSLILRMYFRAFNFHASQAVRTKYWWFTVLCMFDIGVELYTYPAPEQSSGTI